MGKRYLLAVLLVLSFASLFIGVQNVSPMDLFKLTEEQAHILWASRIPRLVSILIAGMSMSICGMIMQQLSRNKFVSPTTAGTLDAARIGILVSLMIFTSASPLQKAAISFVFALLGTLVFMKILDNLYTAVRPHVWKYISSITTFFAYKNDLIQNMSSWLHGDFSMIVEGQYELIYISLPALILAYLFADKFTVAGMGEEFSVNLGRGISVRFGNDKSHLSLTINKKAA